METALREPPVAKSKKGRPPSGRTDATVKMDKALASRAKAIAQHRGVPVAEVVSEAARAIIDKQFVAMIREKDEKR